MTNSERIDNMQQSFDTSLKSPTKRLGVSLNLDTGYNKGKAEEDSPPVTPVAQIRPSRGNTATVNRALKGKTGGPRETFLDDITPIDGSMMRENDNERAGGPYQDSHDLALSPRQVTRDSLVDHMLFSLDQYSYDGDQEGMRQSVLDEQRLYSSFGDDDSYSQPPQNFGPRNGRSASHGYSYSSDFDNGDNSSQYSGHMSRGRRSNSSSNFQSGLGRINSVRNESGGNQGFGASRNGNGTKGPAQIQTRVLHSRSGVGGSKGSSANSLDLGYAQNSNNQKWTHGLPGRSSSFDYGSDHQALNIQTNTNTLARQQINASVASFSHYDYDAAPTPTIPGGPSRPRPSSPILISHHSEPQKPVAMPQKLERKRSTRSSKSAYKAKNLTDYGLHDNSRELPPMPAFVKEPAPAPLVGYGKSKEAMAPPKEKQGFFRKIFGSSRNHPVAAPEPPRSHGSTTSAETTGERPNSKSHHIASQMRSQHTPPSRDAPPAPPAPKEHILTKKPSSFFRRRKKSASELDAPVPVPIVPPMLLAPKKDVHPVISPSSPVSSLRNIMDPYIRTPQKSPVDMFPHESIDRQMNDSPEPPPRTMRGFSPEYEPNKNATIRAVKPPPRDAPSRDAESIPSSSYSSVQKPFLSAGSYDGQRDEHDVTFLQDSSDNDHSTSSRSVQAVGESSDSRYLGEKKTITPSVARDMALVAEYERAYSKRSPTSTKFESPKQAPGDLSKTPDIKSSNSKNIVVKKDEKEWVMLTPTKLGSGEDPESRVWLEPSSSDEETPTTLQLPSKYIDQSKRTSESTETVYKSATSLPIVQVEGEEDFEENPPKSRMMTATEASQALDELVQKEALKTPDEEDRKKAKQIFDGNEDFVTKEKAAAWMGEENVARVKVLHAYMELYDFSNLNILAALRVMCGKLVLKGESQQVDRILDSFAKRWCECNSDHGFKVTGKSSQ